MNNNNNKTFKNFKDVGNSLIKLERYQENKLKNNFKTRKLREEF